MRALLSILVLSISVLRLSGQVTWNVPSTATPDFATAVAIANVGDRILFAPGYYSTAGISVPIRKPLKIQGAGINQTFLHGDVNPAATTVLDFQLVAGAIRIEDLTILPTASGALASGMSHRQGIRVGPVPGGAFYAPVTLVNVRIKGCQGPAGGAFETGFSGQIDATNCEFEQNVSFGAVDGGGAILAHQVKISGCRFANNLSAQDGGAIFVTRGAVDIAESRFEQNTAFGAGGVIAGRSGYAFELKNCRFLGNSATSAAIMHIRRTLPGPWLPIRGAQVLVYQCYIQGNPGGGSARLFDLDTENFSLVASTIRDNPSVSTAPLGVATTSAAGNAYISIRDCIIEDPVDATMVLTAVPGPTGLPPAPLSSTLTVETSIIHDPPIVNAVYINYGPVLDLDPAYASFNSDSYLLLPGSPAVDAGSQLLADTDLDGNPRPVGARRDIGCFELQNLDPGPAFAGTSSTSDLFLFNGTNGGLSRTVTVDTGSICTLEMAEPIPGQVAPFVLWGYLGVPRPTDAFPIPYAGGSMAFTPQLVDPNNPLLFTMTENITPAGAGLIMSRPAPWFYTGPTWHVPITMTLQGLIADGTGPLKITNAMILHAR
ncbi:MAG: hypothetical protein H6807_15445 [Planctomycetes bacterium]|nr:hypothetical protein [Planctomycetota bacterium]